MIDHNFIPCVCMWGVSTERRHGKLTKHDVLEETNDANTNNNYRHAISIRIKYRWALMHTLKQ